MAEAVTQVAILSGGATTPVPGDNTQIKLHYNMRAKKSDGSFIFLTVDVPIANLPTNSSDWGNVYNDWMKPAWLAAGYNLPTDPEFDPFS